MSQRSKQILTWCRKLRWTQARNLLSFKVIHDISRSQRPNKLSRLVAAIKLLRLPSQHIFKYIRYTHHIHKLSKFHLYVKLTTKPLTLTPTSFFKGHLSKLHQQSSARLLHSLTAVRRLDSIGLKVIMGSRDQWEFPPLFFVCFFRRHWQSLCTALTAGIACR